MSLLLLSSCWTAQRQTRFYVKVSFKQGLHSSGCPTCGTSFQVDPHVMQTLFERFLNWSETKFSWRLLFQNPWFVSITFMFCTYLFVSFIVTCVLSYPRKSFRKVLIHLKRADPNSKTILASDFSKIAR